MLAADASAQFHDLLKAHGATCSMSRLGDVWECKPVRPSGSNDPVDRSKAQNAAMRSFFSSLKIERIRSRVCRSSDEARADVLDYVERFYNLKRRHSTLGYPSPVDFEKQAMQAELAVNGTGGSSLLASVIPPGRLLFG